jgi:hypothetical protein
METWHGLTPLPFGRTQNKEKVKLLYRPLPTKQPHIPCAVASSEACSSTLMDCRKCLFGSPGWID